MVISPYIELSLCTEISKHKNEEIRVFTMNYRWRLQLQDMYVCADKSKPYRFVSFHNRTYNTKISMNTFMDIDEKISRGFIIQNLCECIHGSRSKSRVEARG